MMAIATTHHWQCYAEKGNGIHAWAAYMLARRLHGGTRYALPDWILAYLDDVAARLMAPGATASPQAITGALSLDTKRGGPSARERAVKALQHLAVRQQVARRRKSGQAATDAEAAVAQETGLSVDQIDRIRHPRRKKPSGKAKPPQRR